MLALARVPHDVAALRCCDATVARRRPCLPRRSLGKLPPPHSGHFSVIDRFLHVLICNERLLPRFGVDRLLLLLGGGLRRRGHRITYLCQRCDRGAVETLSRDVIELSSSGVSTCTARRLRQCSGSSNTGRNWRATAARMSSSPAAGLSCRVAEVCARPGRAKPVHRCWRYAARGHPRGRGAGSSGSYGACAPPRLPRFTAVLPISNFIRDTQTLPERGTAAASTRCCSGRTTWRCRCSRLRGRCRRCGCRLRR